MSPDKPCQCPRCGWLGTLHDSHELQTEPVQSICPRCATETVVQSLGKKGLNGLRREYELLFKMSYRRDMTSEEKAERRAQIDRFFVHIDLPLRIYDAEAIAKYSEEHADDPTGREDL